MKILAVVLSVAFFVLGILYWKGAVQIGASHPGPHHSHGILFLILGVLALVWARFQANDPKTTASGSGVQGLS